MYRDTESGNLVPKFPNLEAHAKKYGRVEYLLSPSAGPWNVAGALADLEKGLKNFKDGDHLLLIGNPILIGLATAVAAQLSEKGRLIFLQWSGKSDPPGYIEVPAQIYEDDHG